VIANKLRAMMVVARRDFVTVVFSKSFVTFLLGPLFMVAIGAMAGGIGRASQDADHPVIGLAMTAADTDAMIGSRHELDQYMPGMIPEFTVIERLKPGVMFDANRAMHGGKGQLAAVVSGTPAEPVLTATRERVGDWEGLVATVAGRAAAADPTPFAKVRTQLVATSAAQTNAGQLNTAQFGQMLMFLLTMLLATMVLSNLVEEKSNKIIEILAAAIPLDALFLGKLFAMLAVSFVGIAVWGSGAAVLLLSGGGGLPTLPTPAVGWPWFVSLGVIYFAMSYLLLGSVYLAIGGIANTVRDIQTLALPASLLQVAMFFFASYALVHHGQPIEWVSTAFPLTSPYAMLARAAMDKAIWPHVIALVWQGAWVLASIAYGARLFRRTVMKSGGATGRKASRRGLVAIIGSALSRRKAVAGS
jgi:ABC-2 type transport system permease protein